MAEKPTGIALLREPFQPHQISKLPKPTKKQTDDVKADFTKGIRCTLCGAWHHKDVVHLDYVGHAALTDRLLDADPEWQWEPAALKDGLPAFDATGGLWIKLTVCGVTRLGYGHAASKPNQDPGAREKEVIGDALRNAAMRFGAALDLWHKGDLHATEEDRSPPVVDSNQLFEADVAAALKSISRETSLESLGEYWVDFAKNNKSVAADARVIAAKDKRKVDLRLADTADSISRGPDDMGGDFIPYAGAAE